MLQISKNNTIISNEHTVHGSSITEMFQMLYQNKAAAEVIVL